MTIGEAPPALDQQRDPTLGYLLRLVLVALPIGALLLATHSKSLLTFAGGVIALAVLARFPAPAAVRLTATILVLAPDAVVVAQVGGAPLSLRECAFVWFALVCFLQVMRGHLAFAVPAPLLTTVVILIAVLGAVANDRSSSLLEFGVLVVIPLICGATIGTNLAIAIDFIRGIAAGTFVLIGVALTESITNHNFVVTSTELGSFIREGHIRANAGWDYPTMLSAFLCLGGFFVVHFLGETWRWPGLIMGAALVTAAILVTQSRSGLLGLGVGALTYLLLQRRASQVIRVLGGLLAAGGLMLLIPGAAPAGFRIFLSQSLDQGTSANANVSYREELYHAAGTAMAHQPIWGFGWGSGKSVATNDLGRYFGGLTDLASLPVSLGVQLGYVGAAAIGLFLLLVVAQMARHRDVPSRLPIAAGIVGCSVAMTGVPVSPPLSWMLLVAALGWSLVRSWLGRQVEHADPSDQESPQQAGSALGTSWTVGPSRA